jgi:hypothetical protein
MGVVGFMIFFINLTSNARMEDTALQVQSTQYLMLLRKRVTLKVLD